MPPLRTRWQRRIIVTDGQPLDVVLPVLGHWLVEGGLEVDVGNAVLLCHSLILQSTAQPMCNGGMCTDHLVDVGVGGSKEVEDVTMLIFGHILLFGLVDEECPDGALQDLQHVVFVHPGSESQTIVP